MKAVAYCASVESAKRLADKFNQAGIPALEVDGETPKEQRADAVERFRSGDITVLTNVELFTEGLDLPNVDCVIQLRPTQSLGLYMQFAMRSMNPREGKTAIIIDHVKNWERFGLPTDDREWTLEGGGNSKRTSDGDAAPGIKTCPLCFGTFYVSQVKDGKCPLCGQELPKPAPEEDASGDDTNLVEIHGHVTTPAERRLKRLHKIQRNNMYAAIAGKSEGQLETYEELRMYGQLHGYQSGWAWHRAQERGIKFGTTTRKQA